MSLTDVEAKIRSHIAASASSPLILATFEPDNRLYVIKYSNPKHLSDILTTGCLFASNTTGFTWGDAVYVAPLACPRTTMMYGAAGVVGWVDSTNKTFYNAFSAEGISHYQEWIAYHADLYRLLTTTVHANEANRALRNRFRSHFGIDCVYFRPDETCPGYTDCTNDLWLALTQWNGSRMVASGTSGVVKDLAWCAIGTEAFEAGGLGYRPVLHPTLTQGRTFLRSGYKDLGVELRRAYSNPKHDTVVITEF